MEMKTFQTMLWEIQWAKVRIVRWGNPTYCETLWKICRSPYEMMG